MSSPSIYSGNSPHAERALCARARCNWLQCVPQAYRQSFKGQDPRQARQLRPPRENRRGGNLAVFEHPQASYPRSFRCAGPARLGPRSEVVAAAGIGGGGSRLRYQGWPQALLWLTVSLASGCAGEVSDADNTGAGQSDGRQQSADGGTLRLPDGAAAPASNPTEPGSATDDESSSTGQDTSAETSDTFPDGSPVPSGPNGNPPADCTAEEAVRPLSKLSTVQYRNTVRDLLQHLGVPDVAVLAEAKLQAIPEDSRSLLFRGLDSRISLEHVEGYFNVAQTVADAITQDDAHLQRVAGECAIDAALSPDSPLPETCLDSFIDRLGLLTYRRPLVAMEHDELRSVATEGAAALGAREQVRALIVAALISPRFVNHVEIDGALVEGSDDLLLLSPYEMASRIAYTFWQSMPDEGLLEAAADGSLLTEAGRTAELNRVFEDPRTRETLWTFWREWLSLEGFTGFELGRPGFQALAEGTSLDEQTYGAMLEEVRELTDHFTFERPSTLRSLLETNASVTQSATLADIYGVSPWSGQGDFPTFEPGQRSGLFQRAALLVSSLEQTNPFHRGAFYKRYLLCESLPSPDPAALPPGSLDIPPTSSVETTRERFEAKIAGNELCTGCHGLFTEMGYALESFDSIGRFRSTELVFDPQSGELLAELPVNATATVRVGDTTEEVHSPAELNALMVAAGDVEACLAEQYFKFANRRALDPTSSDACVARELASAAADENRGLLQAFRQIAEYRGFYHRRVGAQ